jgi:hypothetical protein
LVEASFTKVDVVALLTLETDAADRLDSAAGAAEVLVEDLLCSVLKPEVVS